MNISRKGFELSNFRLIYGHNYFLAPSTGALAASMARFSASWAAIASSFAIRPPWRVNLRLGENSPSLWPTMFSEQITVIKFLPLCTRKVIPTISGKIVESRDQVLISTFCPGLTFWIFSKSFGSINGPFFSDRDMDYFLRCIINLLDAFFLFRVFTPNACLPQGVFGYFKPIGLWPSPPPCGWSIGFMALPRTDGRMPRWRLRPALPILTYIQSVLETWPTVASELPGILRISPDGSFNVE